MIELIKYVVNRFAEKPDQVEYDIKDDGKDVSVTITLSASDMGKVIGRHGKIAKEIRTLMRSVAQRQNRHISVDIMDAAE